MSYKEDPERYVPTWECQGEMFVKHAGKWVFMSYKCPARLSDLFNENPNLLERKTITGKSGTDYYGYRIKAGSQPKDIADPLIRDFYQQVKLYEKPSIPLA